MKKADATTASGNSYGLGLIKTKIFVFMVSREQAYRSGEEGKIINVASEYYRFAMAAAASLPAVKNEGYK